ncbi:putative UDP-glucose dehydrogenase [Thozetella sp. PMI_491]|nr:putative UDP-glucose dehydrogenase [Thozetella sp. PMI_491]
MPGPTTSHQGRSSWHLRNGCRYFREAWAHLRNVEWTIEPKRIGSATHVLIAVPTPITEERAVDNTNLKAALRTVKRNGQVGATIVIESSIAVGMTRELLAPVMKSRSFRGGISPERVDLGRQTLVMNVIPKIISGLDDVTPWSLQSIRELYSLAFSTLIPTSSPEVAEMTKLYENCQRIIAISFANKVAHACVWVGINPYEVSQAAATKPFGYLSITPGIEVGGHCIPVNPHYLCSAGSLSLLEAATAATERRPVEIGDRLMAGLLRRKPGYGSKAPRVLIVGAAFKPGESLIENSPGLALMYRLQSHWDVPCWWYDPLVDQEASIIRGTRLGEYHWTTQIMERLDLIIFAMRQSKVNWRALDGLVKPQVEVFCSLQSR